MITFSHLGICVSDLDRSLAFYVGALGFEPYESHEIGNDFARLLEIDGDVTLRSRFLRRDGVSIELLHFTTPAADGAGVRRPINKLGLTHLSLRVDDVDGVAAAIKAHGGEVLEHTRTTLGEQLDFLYCTDPDGTRIELMSLPR